MNFCNFFPLVPRVSPNLVVCGEGENFYVNLSLLMASLSNRVTMMKYDPQAFIRMHLNKQDLTQLTE